MRKVPFIDFSKFVSPQKSIIRRTNCSRAKLIAKPDTYSFSKTGKPVIKSLKQKVGNFFHKMLESYTEYVNIVKRNYKMK